MKTIAISVFLAFASPISSVAAQTHDWQRDYLAGLAKIEVGDFAGAVGDFERAVGQNPVPALGGIDYLPWIHLAVARFEAGDAAGARDALVQAQVRSVAPASKTGGDLIDSYARRIMTAPLPRPAADVAGAPAQPAASDETASDQSLASAGVATVAAAPGADTGKATAVAEPPPAEAQAGEAAAAGLAAGAVDVAGESGAIEGTPAQANAEVLAAAGFGADEVAAEPAVRRGLSDREVGLIRARVLDNCPECRNVKDSDLPWHFHYQMGIDLLTAGDAARALESFIVGARKRADSRRDSRTYGMWFIDYLPYYQIAVAHTRLGNWEAAQDALRLSAQVGEFSPQDGDYSRYAELQTLVDSHVNSKDS